MFDVGYTSSYDCVSRCLTFHCRRNGVCGPSGDSPRQFRTWVYSLVGIGIFGGKSQCFESLSASKVGLLGMFAALSTLYVIHRRQRDVEREKRIQYWHEQVSVRDTLGFDIVSLSVCPSECLPSEYYAVEGVCSRLYLVSTWPDKQQPEYIMQPCWVGRFVGTDPSALGPQGERAETAVQVRQ